MYVYEVKSSQNTSHVGFEDNFFKIISSKIFFTNSAYASFLKNWVGSVIGSGKDPDPAPKLSE
jgi:hypothetical protein